MLDSSTRELLCLWAARERGVLDALATEAGTPADVADTAGVDPAAADAFVTALADAGYVERVGDEYEPTNRLLGFLTKTDLRSVGSLPAALDAVDGWVALGEGDSFESPDALRNDLGAQWATDEATVRAAVTAAIRAAPGADAAAVVGDGPGRHARDLLARGLDATIVETPARADAVEPLLSPTAVRLEAGGPEAIPDADLVLLPGFLERHDDPACERWLAAAAEAAPVVVAVGPLRDRSSGGALADLEAVARGEGRVRPAAAVRGLFAAAGLDCAVEAVPGTPLFAAVGRRVQ
ncbi:hypothetical protein [Halosegnis marinus]|uniref:Uncharacterized protein n=1 Tax=Halosegnis marinus TaxID=3034023 RepID=A0ABD5ZNR8_9EURY|nr:hypothetical protein [Halosegnis sp. DT85]